IFAVTIVVWAIGYFPRDASVEPPVRDQYQRDVAALQDQVAAKETEISLRQDLEPADDPANQTQYKKWETSLEKLQDDQSRLIENQQKLEHEDALAGRIQSAYMRNSYLGRIGRAIEPVVKPLGWDWRIGCAAIASFPAREVVIGVMGVIYNLGEDQDEESVDLRSELAAATWDDDPSRKVYTVPAALSVMVFFALCAQCVSTLAVMRRETNSWRWPVFTFVYMTTLAYVGALVTYQVGMLFVS
ncbi:MAG: ferrous iron transport protein B, partial [Planctomycetales bacterium]